MRSIEFNLNFLQPNYVLLGVNHLLESNSDHKLMKLFIWLICESETNLSLINTRILFVAGEMNIWLEAGSRRW